MAGTAWGFDDYVHGKRRPVSPRIKIIIGIGLLSIVASIILFRTRVETDISLFLPRSSTPQEQFLISQFQQGPGAKLLMISLQGADSKILATLSESLSERLKKSKAFYKVINSEEPLDPKTEEFLFSKRFLLSPTIHPDRFSPKELNGFLSNALDRLALSRGFLEKRYLLRDPTGEFLSTLRSWGDAPVLNKKHGVWFSRDGNQAFLVAEIVAEGFNLNRFENAIGEIRNAFDALHSHNEITMILVGPPAFAVASRDSIRTDATRLSLIATCLVIAIIFLFYRSGKVVLISAIPLFCGILTSIAVVVLIFESIHGITLAFGIVILGVAIDYPIHLFSHMKSGEHPTQAMERIWPTMRLGVLTTAFGYISMLFSQFDGLVQLAIFAVCGLATAAGVTRYILPHIMGPQLSLSNTVSLNKLRPFLEKLSHGKIVVYIFLAGSIIFLGLHQEELWENDVAQLSPVPASQLALDKQLREQLNLPNLSYLVVVKGISEQSVLELTELVGNKLQILKDEGAINGFDAVTKYLPSLAKQKQRLNALPEIKQLRENLRIAQTGLPFRKNSFDTFIRDVSEAKNSQLLTYDRLRGTLLETPVNKLFYQQEDFWFSLISFKGIADPDPITRAIKNFPSHEVFILEPRKTSNALINRYRDRALVFFALGCLIIIATLRIALGRRAALTRVLVPVFGAVLVVMAILVAAQVRLSLFHLVALLLVIGLGLDYALFMNRPKVSETDQWNTHHSLIVCNLSTVTVFCVLSFSDTPVLNALGTTVALGAFLCLLFSFIFAPKLNYASENV